MRREIMSMTSAMPRLRAAENPTARDRSGSALADLFEPLDYLLACGGDPRLQIDRTSGANDYGCRPFPCPNTLSFASCTATSISERAYVHVSHARESLMRSAIAAGLEAAFDARIESMRDELKACLGLSRTDAEVVFSSSGTDAQLQALWLARALLGPALTTVIVAADQTGSGTGYTARGRHFNAATANGIRVRKGEPIEGLADHLASMALGALDAAGSFCPRAESDARVLDAVEQAIANGSKVLLQVMDSSKLGWRAPSDQCLDEIATRWPDSVQIVVDACQMRLGRPRLRRYLERGYIVIVTGSKFFTGPAFSGALLVPADLSKALDAVTEVATGLSDYSSRSDWPMNWPRLRSRFPVRANFGQWLRWEAALAEMWAYYGVPGEFRLRALATFGKQVERIIASSPSLRLLPCRQGPEDRGIEDEELALPTIFPFVIRRHNRVLSLGDCRKIHRALACTVRPAGPANGRDRLDLPTKICLVGQPVALGDPEREPLAALRICAGARLVTEAWSSDPDTTRGNLKRELGRVGTVVSKIEWLVAHLDGQDFVEACHEA
jgi:hypothetical protein